MTVDETETETETATIETETTETDTRGLASVSLHPSLALNSTSEVCLFV
jgi:hypothetical protein